MVAYLNSLLAFGSLSPLELIVILVIALLVFGSRLPTVARNMGKSISEFKKGVKEGEEEASKSEIKPADKP